METRAQEKAKTAVTALGEVALALRASQNVLTETAGKAADKDVVRLLYQLALEQSEMGLQLRDQLRQVKDTITTQPDSCHEPANSICQVTALVDNNSEDLLSAVERIEDRIAHLYKRALALFDGLSDVSEPARLMLRRHQAKIEQQQRAVFSLRTQQDDTSAGGS